MDIAVAIKLLGAVGSVIIDVVVLVVVGRTVVVVRWLVGRTEVVVVVGYGLEVVAEQMLSLTD